MKYLSSLDLPSVGNRLSEILPSAITAEKTEEAICRLRANKSTGGDGFPSAVHKPSGGAEVFSPNILFQTALKTADYGERPHQDHVYIRLGLHVLDQKLQMCVDRQIDVFIPKGN